jgi:hypothetical protein
MTDAFEMCTNSMYPPIDTAESTATAIVSEAILRIVWEMKVRFGFGSGRLSASASSWSCPARGSGSLRMALARTIHLNAHCSSSPSKANRAAMGFSFHSIGCVKRAKECWNETHTICAPPCGAKTKEKPAGVNRRPLETPPAHTPHHMPGRESLWQSSEPPTSSGASAKPP